MREFDSRKINPENRSAVLSIYIPARPATPARLVRNFLCYNACPPPPPPTPTLPRYQTAVFVYASGIPFTFVWRTLRPNRDDENFYHTADKNKSGSVTIFSVSAPYPSWAAIQSGCLWKVVFTWMSWRDTVPTFTYICGYVLLFYPHIYSLF